MSWAPGITLFVILGVLSVWSAYINFRAWRSRRARGRDFEQWLQRNGDTERSYRG